jgi:hypothetical protein
MVFSIVVIPLPDTVIRILEIAEGMDWALSFPDEGPPRCRVTLDVPGLESRPLSTPQQRHSARIMTTIIAVNFFIDITSF